MAAERHGTTLIDRVEERRVIDRLVAAVQAGHSQVLVMQGEVADINSRGDLHRVLAVGPQESPA
jgi:hypothetical protein